MEASARSIHGLRWFIPASYMDSAILSRSITIDFLVLFAISLDLVS